MKLYKILRDVLVTMALLLGYYYVSINVSISGKLVISLVLFVFLLVLFIKSLSNISKSDKLKNVNPAELLFLCVLLFTLKSFVDFNNIIIEGKNSSILNITIAQIHKFNRTMDYNTAFQNTKYKQDNIYYSKDLEPAMKLIYAYIDTAKTDDAKLFGNIYHAPVSIRFDYDKKSFKDRNPAFKDYTGLYSPNKKSIYILVEDCFKDALTTKAKSYDLQYTVIHEYTHHMYFQFLKDNNINSNRIPIWFDEGIADYVGYGEDEASLPKKLVEFNSMNTLKQWVDYNNRGYDTYAQSRLAVKVLTSSKGNEVIKKILLQTKYMNFEEAFKNATGLTLEEFKLQLEEDKKNKWNNYYDMSYEEEPRDYTNIQIQCLENYLKKKTGNLDARMDLASLYNSEGSLEKAKQQFLMILIKSPNNEIAMNRLAHIYTEMEDYDSAINTYEKYLGLTTKKTPVYINLAQIYLIKDLNKSVSTLQTAKETDNSKSLNAQYEAINSYKDSVSNNQPYEGCLKLIKSNTIYSRKIKKTLITKIIKDYPNINNSARSDLEKLYKSYK